jgi:hypothetical protein
LFPETASASHSTIFSKSDISGNSAGYKPCSIIGAIGKMLTIKYAGQHVNGGSMYHKALNVVFGHIQFNL